MITSIKSQNNKFRIQADNALVTKVAYDPVYSEGVYEIPTGDNKMLDLSSAFANYDGSKDIVFTVNNSEWPANTRVGGTLVVGNYVKQIENFKFSNTTNEIRITASDIKSAIQSNKSNSNGITFRMYDVTLTGNLFLDISFVDPDNDPEPEPADITLLSADFSNNSTNQINGIGVRLNFSGNKTVENGALKLTSIARASDDNSTNNWDTALTFSFDDYEDGTVFEISFDYWTTTGSCNNLNNIAQAGSDENYKTVKQTPLGTLSPTSEKKTVTATVDTSNGFSGTMKQISVQLNSDKDNKPHIFFFDNFSVVKKQ